MPPLRNPVGAFRSALAAARFLPAVATVTLAAAATVATLGVSCSEKDGGAAGEGQGGESGQGGEGQGGEAQGGEGQAGGESGAGGGGGMAGNADAGSAGTGGTLDATPDTKAARACKGAPNSGTGDDVQVMRTDMSVIKRLDTPDDATRLAQDPVSGQLFMMVEDGTISRIDTQGDTWSRSVVYTPASIGLATGDRAYGMGFGPDGTLYVVSHLPKEKSASSSVATVWQGKLANDGARTWRKLAQTAPYGRSNTIFDHEWSGVAVSPDGKHVFINAGSRTDHGEQHGGARESALTAKIFRLPTDAAQTIALGDDLADLKAKGYVFAEGVRNAYDPAFAPNGDLLAGDNGPDADYHEELIHIEQGKHYGFPWRLGNEDNQMQFPSYDPTTDKRLDPAYEAIKLRYWYKDSTFPAKPAGVALVEPILNVGPAANQYRDPTSGEVKRGNIGTFSDHGSPVGLTFDLAKEDLCGPFHGAAFILRHGKAAGDFEDGRDLLLLELTKENGVYKQVKVTQLARFFQGPVDAVLVGDKMFVLDRGSSGRGGKLWEIGMPNGR